MLDHIGFAVSDYARSKAFYEKALAPLGITVLLEPSGQAAGFGQDGHAFFWVEAQGRPPKGRLHVAFTAEDRDTVDAFHVAALKAGGKDNGAPGARKLYHPDYYGAYVLDPDGHNIEAVCHRPKEGRGVGHRVLPAGEANWRPSHQMGVANTDLAKQLEATTLAARLWRLEPGQASTRHRHAHQDELYVLLEGTGRMRVDEDVLTLDTRSAVHIDADTVRQLFNDTDADQLWLVVGAPREAANTLEMTDEQLRFLYPDGPKARPPELSGD